MSLSEKFLCDVQIFVTELGISQSALGQKSVGDASLISEIRKGRSPTLRTADRIYAYMAHERTRRADPSYAAGQLRRVEAGARRSTAYLSEAEAQDRAAALEGSPGFWAWFKGLMS